MSRSKTYAFVFILSLLVANIYTFSPAFEYANRPIMCPAIFWNSQSMEATEFAQDLGAPLYSVQQALMKQGTSAYLIESYDSTGMGNNLTRLLKGYYQDSFTFLEKLNALNGGQTSQVPANETGVSIVIENVTFPSIYHAKLVYRITVQANASAASYLLDYPACGNPGFVLTVGAIPYIGPLPYGIVQPIEVLVNNAIALVVATVASLLLARYWSRKDKKKITIAQVVSINQSPPNTQ